MDDSKALKTTIEELVTPLERYGASPSVLSEFILATLGKPSTLKDVDQCRVESEDFRKTAYMFLGIDTDVFISSFLTLLRGRDGAKRSQSQQDIPVKDMESLSISDDNSPSTTLYSPSSIWLSLSEKKMFQFLKNTFANYSHCALSIKTCNIAWLRPIYIPSYGNLETTATVEIEQYSIERDGDGEWVSVKAKGEVTGVKICDFHFIVGQTIGDSIIPL